MSVALPCIPSSIPTRSSHRISSLLLRLLLLLLIFLLLSQHLRIQLRCPLSSRAHAIHLPPASRSIHRTLREALSLLLLVDGFS